MLPSKGILTPRQQSPRVAQRVLANGLTLYLSPQHNCPRVECRIVVKAGAAQDPPHATGVAHMLEHLMFKGSEVIGTLDAPKELPLLREIKESFERLKGVGPEEERIILKHIDRLNQQAVAVSLPGEYDQILSHLGAEGVNAYTRLDETIYRCDIPSNELSRWAVLELERFQRPLMRSFLTEIEAIYEEYNQDLDDDFSRARDLLMAGLFPNHPYGRWGILGKKEHLCCPSLENLEAFRQTWYRPDNMALCLAGDFIVEEVLTLLEGTWGCWRPPQAEKKPLPTVAHPLGPRKSQVFSLQGRDSAFVLTGFRFGGRKSPEYPYLYLLDLLLSNSQAGMIDLNLIQRQRILTGGSSLTASGDHGWFVLYGVPRAKQSLGGVHRLLMKQLRVVQRRQYDGDILSGIIKILEIEEIQSRGSSEMADALSECFAEGLSWEESQSFLGRLRRIRPEELSTFVKKSFNIPYVRVDKKEGEPLGLELMEKLEVTPLQLDYDGESPFFQSLRKVSPEVQEPFLPAYEEVLSHQPLGKGIQLTHSLNEENGLFEISFIFFEGKSASPWLPLVAEYFFHLGTQSLSPGEVQKRAFLLGADIDFQVDLERSLLTLSGKEEDLPAILELLEELVKSPRGSCHSYQRYWESILKRRRDGKMNKRTLLLGALYSWGLYGPDSPFRTILSERELAEGSHHRLIAELQRLFTLPHHIAYHGNRPLEGIRALLEKYHLPQTQGKPEPRTSKVYREKAGEGKILFLHHDMVQAEIYRLAVLHPFSFTHLPSLTLFNEFFGAGLNSLFFQEVREARGLAYSAYSHISTPDLLREPHILQTYVGTQGKKLLEALEVVDSLLRHPPKASKSFKESQQVLLKGMASQRILGADIFWSWWEARELGLDPTFQKELFHALASYSFPEMEDYFQKWVCQAPQTVLVLGNREDLDREGLAKKGELQEMDIDELFGY